MAKKWDFDEKMLIEVFGCTSLDRNVIELSGNRSREMFRSDFYLNGNTIEGMLIETFGCISLDKIINIDSTRDRKKVQLPLVQDDISTMAVGIA